MIIKDFAAARHNVRERHVLRGGAGESDQVPPAAGVGFGVALEDFLGKKYDDERATDTADYKNKKQKKPAPVSC